MERKYSMVGVTFIVSKKDCIIYEGDLNLINREACGLYDTCMCADLSFETS